MRAAGAPPRAPPRPPWRRGRVHVGPGGVEHGTGSPKRAGSEDHVGYVVAKANETARPFVARAEKVRDGWTVLGRYATYAEALRALAVLA